MDLLEAVRRPFLKFAASSDQLLYGSTVYADDSASVALEWLGGLRFLLSLGVRNVLSFEDAANRVKVSSSNGNKDGAFQYQRHGLQPPTSDGVKHTAVFFVTSELWDAETRILDILADARTRREGAFDRCLVCCSLSEMAHACSPHRPDIWRGTTFKFSKYKRTFKTCLNERLQHHVPPSCLISVRHFPLVINVLLDSRIKGRGAHAHMGEAKCLGLFTLTHERSRRLFPTTPSRLSSQHRTATGGSLSRMTIDHLPSSSRSSLRVAAHQLANALSLLGLDITGNGAGYGVGHEHSAIAFGETVLSIASEGTSLGVSSGNVRGGTNGGSSGMMGDGGTLRPASLVIIDRTVDLVSPSSSAGRTWVDQLRRTKSKAAAEYVDSGAALAGSVESRTPAVERRRQIASTFAHANNPKVADLARSLMLWDPQRSKEMVKQTAARIVRSLTKSGERQQIEDNSGKSMSGNGNGNGNGMTTSTRVIERWLSNLVLKMEDDTKEDASFANKSRRRKRRMHAAERMERRCLLDSDFGLVEIVDQLCELLIKTWWIDEVSGEEKNEEVTHAEAETEAETEKKTSVLTYRDVMILMVQLFSYQHSEEMDASCLKKLRIHMAAGLLNGERSQLLDLQWLPHPFIDAVLAWQPKRKIPDIVVKDKPNKPNKPKKMTTTTSNKNSKNSNDGGDSSDDQWDSDDGWGSDDDDDLLVSDDDIDAANETTTGNTTTTMDLASLQKQEQERMLRVHTEDDTGVQLQHQADAMIHEMLSRLFEISTGREKLQDFTLLLHASTAEDNSGEEENEENKEDFELHLVDDDINQRNDYVPLLSQLCRHVFNLYSGDGETTLSNDFVPLADYSVASTIKSVADTFTSFSSFFGGGGGSAESSEGKSSASGGGGSMLGGGGGEEDNTTLVFFVLGGVTSYEVREIHRAMEETGMSHHGDVIVGSTRLLTEGDNDIWNTIFMELAE